MIAGIRDPRSLGTKSLPNVGQSNRLDRVNYLGKEVHDHHLADRLP